MRIKLTHLIGVSLFSLSVVFATVPNAGAAGVSRDDHYGNTSGGTESGNTSGGIATQLPREMEQERPEPIKRETVHPAVTSWSETINSMARWEIVLDGYAVLDHETGLVWERYPKDVHKLNLDSARNKCISKRIGHGGWHIPTVEQLTSFLTAGDIPENPLFQDALHKHIASTKRYWTASDAPYQQGGWIASDKWSVNGGGDVSLYDDPAGNYLWCVRGGQARINW